MMGELDGERQGKGVDVNEEGSVHGLKGSRRHICTPKNECCDWGQRNADDSCGKMSQDKEETPKDCDERRQTRQRTGVVVGG